MFVFVTSTVFSFISFFGSVWFLSAFTHSLLHLLTGERSDWCAPKNSRKNLSHWHVHHIILQRNWNCNRKCTHININKHASFKTPKAMPIQWAEKTKIFVTALFKTHRLYQLQLRLDETKERERSKGKVKRRHSKQIRFSRIWREHNFVHES